MLKSFRKSPKFCYVRRFLQKGMARKLNESYCFSTVILLLFFPDSEICNKIQNDLQIGHEKLCPWPQNPCPPSFLSLPSLTTEQWKVSLKESFDGLVHIKGNLPELNEDEIAAMVM